MFGYNRLVRLRNEVNTGWSNIDVQLQRRADLIPNLVETVTRVRGARARRVRRGDAGAGRAPAGRLTGRAAEANEGLTAALGRLFAVAEAYPS